MLEVQFQFLLEQKFSKFRLTYLHSKGRQVGRQVGYVCEAGCLQFSSTQNTTATRGSFSSLAFTRRRLFPFFTVQRTFTEATSHYKHSEDDRRGATYQKVNLIFVAHDMPPRLKSENSALGVCCIPQQWAKRIFSSYFGTH